MTGYIAEMRKLVGHRTLIQCAASIICVDEQGRILLGKRSDNKMWGYSGGAVEIDERVEDCAKRELYEEMGLTAEELTFFYVNSGPEAHYIIRTATRSLTLRSSIFAVNGTASRSRSTARWKNCGSFPAMRSICPRSLRRFVRWYPHILINFDSVR